MLSNFYVCEKNSYQMFGINSTAYSLQRKGKTFVHIKKMHTKVCYILLKGYKEAETIDMNISSCCSIALEKVIA